jgi:TfoX/Sxy family transcriptional regulator of competence genes
MNMAVTELADRIRDALEPLRVHCVEKRMFGGIAFMLHGNMLVCPMSDGALLVRVGKEGINEALALPGATAMEMAGRKMGGFVAVSGDALEDDDSLSDWIGRARRFVDTLPPK